VKEYEHEIWYMEYKNVRFDTRDKKFVLGRFTSDNVKKLSKYTLKLVGVHKMRWDGGGTE
jgi:hypothetical protein